MCKPVPRNAHWLRNWLCWRNCVHMFRATSECLQNCTIAQHSTTQKHTLSKFVNIYASATHPIRHFTPMLLSVRKRGTARISRTHTHTHRKRVFYWVQPPPRRIAPSNRIRNASAFTVEDKVTNAIVSPPRYFNRFTQLRTSDDGEFITMFGWPTTLNCIFNHGDAKRCQNVRVTCDLLPNKICMIVC